MQLAHELDEAMDLADFAKSVRLVLRQFKAPCYGQAKRRHARIKAARLAARYGYPRQFAEKGLRRLLDAGVLVAVEDVADAYKLNKLYRTWTFADGSTHPDGNGSRFSDDELAQIKAAPDIAWTYADSPAGPDAQKHAPNGVQSDAPNGVHDAPNGVPNCTQRGASSHPTGCIPPHPPIRKKIRERESEREFVVDAGEAQPGEVRTPEEPGQAELERWAEALIPGEGGPSKVAGWASSRYPLDWIRDAIMCGFLSAKPGGAWQYAQKCLMKWRRLGGPVQAEVEAARAAMPAGPGGEARGGPAAPKSKAEQRRNAWKAENRRLAELEARDGDR